MPLDSALTLRAMPPGSMRYYAWLFANREQREVLAALFVIESELRDSARATHEVAHIRLQWWREEFDRLIDGKAQHPATQALQRANAANNTRADFSLLQRAHTGAAQELAHATYEHDAELTQYLHDSLGSLSLLAVQLAAPTVSDEMTAAATRLGAFVRQVETLRDLRHDFHQGRLYLPLAVLDAQQIDYESLQLAQWPPAFVALLTARITTQLADFNTLKQSMLDHERILLRPWRVLAELHADVLAHIATDPQQHTRQRKELKPFNKLWTAWRAARHA